MFAWSKGRGVAWHGNLEENPVSVSSPNRDIPVSCFRFYNIFPVMSVNRKSEAASCYMDASGVFDLANIQKQPRTPSVVNRQKNRIPPKKTNHPRTLLVQ